MDGCTAAVAAAYLRCKQRIKTIAQWALVLGWLDEENEIMSHDDGPKVKHPRWVFQRRNYARFSMRPAAVLRGVLWGASRFKTYSIDDVYI